MSYCDICGYPAPCGREHYWLEQERLWEEALNDVLVRKKLGLRSRKQARRQKTGLARDSVRSNPVPRSLHK